MRLGRWTDQRWPEGACERLEAVGWPVNCRPALTGPRCASGEFTCAPHAYPAGAARGLSPLSGEGCRSLLTPSGQGCRDRLITQVHVLLGQARVPRSCLIERQPLVALRPRP